MEDTEYSNEFCNPKLFGKIGCTLQAYGGDFNPIKFLNESNLPEDKILGKGILGLPSEIREKVRKEERCRDAFDIFDTPYLLISVSDKDELLLQIEDATFFLKHYLYDLKKLRFYPNVENLLIRFLVRQNKSVSDFQNFPTDFSNLISLIGIDDIVMG